MVLVRCIGLSSCIGALVGAILLLLVLDEGREDWRRDWRARQLLRIEVGDAQEVAGGGERILVIREDGG